MKLKPLARRSMLQLYPIMEDFQKINEDNPVQMLEIVDRGIEAIAGHVDDIQGFTVDDRQPQLEDIVQETMFTPLVIQIMSQLVTISTLSLQSEKNSEGPST